MQIMMNGFVNGLLLACLALGFSIVYLPTRIFFIALGAVYALTPYIAKSVLGAGGPWWLSVAAAIGMAVVISALCELLNHRPLEKKQASEGAHLIASLGVYIVLVEVIAVVWGSDPQVLRTGLDEVYRFGGLILTRAQLLAALVSFGLLAAFYTWLRFSNLGLHLRAMADNATEFALRGFNLHAYRLLVFCLAAVLAASASMLSAYDVGFDPYGGLHMLLLAIVAVIIGGRGSFRGPIIGGLLLGLLRSLVVWHISARWQDVATFALLALFLYVRPYGICGRPARLEVEA